MRRVCTICDVLISEQEPLDKTLAIQGYCDPCRMQMAKLYAVPAGKPGPSLSSRDLIANLLALKSRVEQLPALYVDRLLRLDSGLTLIEVVVGKDELDWLEKLLSVGFHIVKFEFMEPIVSMEIRKCATPQVYRLRRFVRLSDPLYSDLKRLSGQFRLFT